MRKLHFINQAKETGLIQKLIYQMKRKHVDFTDPNETLMLTVSPDFSGIVSTILSHGVSTNGQAMYSDCIHVPDPGEEPDLYRTRLKETFEYVRQKYEGGCYSKFILCEAGVISGRNYLWLVEDLKELGVPSENILTVALLENTESKFKCDLVGEYYNNNEQDLCFWWENPNRAFDDFSSKESN
jgi:hypothetical protein